MSTLIDEVDTMIQHELNLNEDPYETMDDVGPNLDELSFPYSPQEPELSADELQRLDSIADQVEVERLSGLQVLQEDNLPHDAKSLSTRFVRTWREKKDKQGNAIWLRRSRLVAREYTWLQPDREALFSPATSNIASRILPICFLALREHQDTMMLAIDVKDAFLTVKQEQPTRVRCTDASGKSVSYSLGRVLPGQRDGSLLWHRDLVKFVGESSLGMEEFEAYPSILRSKLGDCLLMIHVDDLLVVGSRKAVTEQLIPHMQSRYEVSIEIMSNVGDELTFLKRTHQLLESGRMVVKIHGKHLDQLCKLLQLSKRLQNKKSPGHSEIEIPDKTEELSAHDGSIYRSCVGILLDLSPDLPQCQYVIRYLSTFSSKPTQKTMIVLKHLVGYLAGHADQHVSLRWKGIHPGLLKDYEHEEPVQEVFSDADCASDRDTRRSVSGAAIFFGGCLVYSSSRTQKIVSLSSAESETYAAASAVMDAILIRAIISWVLQSTILMCLYIDSSAARGILSRRGVGRLRHLSCRVLWLQNLVGEKLLMVKAVLGAINPSDIATKRLSISRLESLLYLFGIWDSANNNLVGQHDPGRIFRNVPQPQQNSASRYQVNMLIGALSLLLQGCGSDVPSVAMDCNFQGLTMQATIVTSWITLLTLYMVFLWMRNDQPVRNEVLASDDDDLTSVEMSCSETESCDGLPDFPAFSPESLISWMFERCFRRREDSICNGNSTRALAYTQRMTLLVDLFDHVMGSDDTVRQEAADMFNTMPDLSSDEGSPTYAADEPWEAKKSRLSTAHAVMISLQGSMTMGLGGCLQADTNEVVHKDNGSNPFSFLVLTVWTLLLAAYTWWMLRSPHPRPAPMPVPTPTELAVGPMVTHDTNVLEGLLTWTYARVLGRLDRANRDNNYGRIRKYTESRNWLQRRFADLVHGTPAQRERIQAALTGDNELEEEDDSPTYGYGVVERELLAATHGQIFNLVVKLLELERFENVVELARGIGTSLRAPPNPPSPATTSDEAMTETEEEKLQRYQNSEQCEVSDPDLWATIHYGPADEDDNGDNATGSRDDLMEF